MGREVRKVPPNWEHPKSSDGQYIPLYDRSYREAITEWIENHQLWLEGKHPDQLDPKIANKYQFYAQWSGNAPDVESYLPDIKPEEKTWFQVYETVSEGTPVTPPFATEDELIYHLCNYGTDWDRRRYGAEGAKWSQEAAENFVKGSRWMPSGIFIIPKSN